MRHPQRDQADGEGRGQRSDGDEHGPAQDAGRRRNRDRMEAELLRSSLHGFKFREANGTVEVMQFEGLRFLFRQGPFHILIKPLACGGSHAVAHLALPA